MPDFEHILREKLCRCNRPKHDEVIRELAGHMEDRYEGLLRENVGRDEALQGALCEVGDWKQLQKSIESARRTDMTERAKCVLVPGTAALLVSTLGERLLWHLSTGTPHVYRDWSSWLTVALPMVGVLLIAGAAGAACSLYAGGSKRQRIWSAEFPALCATLLLLILLPWSLFSFSHAATWLAVRGAASRYILFGVLTPAAVLLLGALPFLLAESKSRGVESSAQAHAS